MPLPSDVERRTAEAVRSLDRIAGAGNHRVPGPSELEHHSAPQPLAPSQAKAPKRALVASRGRSCSIIYLLLISKHFPAHTAAPAGVSVGN